MREGSVFDLRTEQELLEAVARGDRDAFATFYDRTASLVLITIQRVLRNRALSEEVAQEVFVELWRQAPRYDPARGNLRAWVTTVARRRAVDRVRAEQAHADREHRVSVRDYLPPRDVVTDAFDANVEADRVRVALARLTPLQREAIELAYFGGRSYREVAEQLGVPLGTMKTRIRDGLRHLRVTLTTDDAVAFTDVA